MEPSYKVTIVSTDHGSPFYVYALPFWPYTGQWTKAKFEVTLAQSGWKISKQRLTVTKRRPTESELQLLHKSYPELAVETMKEQHAYSVKMGYREPTCDWNWLRSWDVENVEVELEFARCACEETKISGAVSYTTGTWGLNLVNFQIKDANALVHWWRTK